MCIQVMDSTRLQTGYVGTADIEGYYIIATGWHDRLGSYVLKTMDSHSSRLSIDPILRYIAG